MNLLNVFLLKFILIQVVFSKLISLRDGEIIYEYDDSECLAVGTVSKIFKGKRVEGEKIDIVALKVAKSETAMYINLFNNEKNMYELVGDHESIPIYYQYFSESSNVKTTIVTELLGENLFELLRQYNRFSTVTIMRIGLQVLDILEHIHTKGVIHYDVHFENLAIAFNNDALIKLFDFNMGKEFGINNNTVSLKEITFSYSSYKLKSPRNDIKDLATTLIALLRKDTIFSFIQDIWKREDDKKITSEEFDYYIGDADCKETLLEFSRMAKDSKHNLPDYETFRKLLSSELEKHKDKPNYDKFDWQITEEI